MADIVLTYGTVVGECTFKNFENKITCQSMSINATQEVDKGANATRTVHTVNIEEITLGRLFDSSSWALLDAMIIGKPYEAKIEILRTGAVEKSAREVFCTYTLTDALLTSCNTSFSDSEVTEEITLNFTKFKIDYKPQAKTGIHGSNVGTNFNLQTGAKE